MTAPEILLADSFARHVAAWAHAAGAPESAGHGAALAARALSLAASEGHVCLELAELAGPQGGAGTASSWRHALLDSGTTGSPDAPGAFPLILDADDRLYLHRDFDFERRLAARIVQARAAPAWPEAQHARVREQLASSFTPADDARRGGPDWQKLAAALALRGRLTIISGGPGTGKTTTVVYLLACLLSVDPECRIALAAPTGKAAARMNEALRERATHLPSELRARLPAGASTVHRLLQAGSDGRFRHDSTHPLPIDVLVVDEASMLDLALATRLLEAVPIPARIVLLGDKDQLSAVEAGAVFFELSRDPSLSAACTADLSDLAGVPFEDIRSPPPRSARSGTVVSMTPRPARAAELSPPRAGVQADLFDTPDIDDAVSTNPLADAVVWLTRNYRFALDSGIGRLARLVNEGAADAAVAWLEAGGDDGVRWWAETAAGPGPSTLEALDAGYDAYVQAVQADPGDRLRATQAFGRFRVLCAQREGPRGVAGINVEMARRLRARVAPTPGVADTSPWYAGRPVIVLANDYVLRLFNGDLGLVLPDEHGDLQVHFADAAAPGGFRAIAPARLPRHDTAFALTVHKAQGSEFEDVLVLLPRRASRVCTREMLYTAITRARRHAAIVAPREVLATTIATSTRRRSGLLARLEEALAASAS